MVNFHLLPIQLFQSLCPPRFPSWLLSATPTMSRSRNGKYSTISGEERVQESPTSLATLGKSSMVESSDATWTQYPVCEIAFIQCTACIYTPWDMPARLPQLRLTHSSCGSAYEAVLGICHHDPPCKLIIICMEGCFVVSKKKRKRLFSFYLKSPSATGWSSKRLTCEATVRI